MKCYDRIAHFRQEGRTIVLVSHALDTIRSMCRDAIWIEKGHLKAYGPSDDVVSDYLGDVHVNNAAVAPHEPGASRWGNGDVAITAVRTMGADGRPTTALRAAEPVAIEVDYESAQPVEELVVGLAIYRADSMEHVHGQNSVRSDLGVKLPPRGTVRLAMDELPLLKGPYVMTVALHDRSSAVVYDWHEREYAFTVLDTARTLGQGGLVYVPATWSLLVAAQPQPSGAV